MQAMMLSMGSTHTQLLHQLLPVSLPPQPFGTSSPPARTSTGAPRVQRVRAVTQSENGHGNSSLRRGNEWRMDRWPTQKLRRTGGRHFLRSRDENKKRV